MSSLLQFISHVSLLTLSHLICLYYSNTMEVKHTLWIFPWNKLLNLHSFLFAIALYIPFSPHTVNTFSPIILLLHKDGDFPYCYISCCITTDKHLRLRRQRWTSTEASGQTFWTSVSLWSYVWRLSLDAHCTRSALSLQMGLTASDITVWLSVWIGGFSTCVMKHFE